MDIVSFLRQLRIGQFAVFDFVVAYLGFYILSPLIIKFFLIFNITVTKANIMWLVLPTSIFTHIAIGRYTPLTKMFLNTSDYYLLKILVIYMLYAGLRGILFK